MRECQIQQHMQSLMSSTVADAAVIAAAGGPEGTEIALKDVTDSVDVEIEGKPVSTLAQLSLLAGKALVE